MKRNGVLIVAVLVAILLGLLIGRLTGPDPAPVPDPAADLNLEADAQSGCVTASVKDGSDATFLIVRVNRELQGKKTVERTGKFTFVTAKTGPKEFCGSRSALTGAGMATAAAAQDGEPDPHIKVFSVTKTKECKDGVCVDHFEDYPLPWPPGT